MKCTVQAYFLGEIEKILCLSSAELAQRVVKVNSEFDP